MRIDWVKIDGFKNLNDFHIDLDENHMNTVLIGLNATGKSNFIEALILIFKYLDFDFAKEKRPNFNFEIKYKIKKNDIQIKFWQEEIEQTLFEIGEIEHPERKLELNVNGKKTYQTTFKENKNDYLPQYIFTYYSGISNRLDEHFWDSQRRFYTEIKKEGTTKEDIDDLRRLFYVKLIHSYFVLLAFFSFSDKKGTNFLKEYLGLEDLDSILFILKKPSWKGTGDKRFWGAHGLVQEFLDKLWDLSLAPIYHSEKIQLDFKSKPTRGELLYLYISSQEKLKELAKFYETNTNLFKALESTYMSDVLGEVKVQVKIHSDKTNLVTFRDLSEGEQQLLTVIGLLKFTREEESLILLDEPDTHLNPLWKWSYLQLLDDIVKKEQSTQLIISTHDPLVIGGLTKEEVRIFEKLNGKIEINVPEFDPKGMGVDGILTSPLFGLPAAFDTDTYEKVIKRNKILYKLDSEDLSDQERSRLDAKVRKLFQELNNLGFAKIDKDPDYRKFLIEQEEKKKSSQ